MQGSFFREPCIEGREIGTRLKNDAKEWIDDEEQIAQTFQSYFQQLYTTVGDREWGSTMEAVIKEISKEMNEELIAEVQEDEIKKIAFQMNPLKAPGPNGRWWAVMCVVQSKAFFIEDIC